MGPDPDGVFAIQNSEDQTSAAAVNEQSVESSPHKCSEMDRSASHDREESELSSVSSEHNENVEDVQRTTSNAVQNQPDMSANVDCNTSTSNSSEMHLLYIN